MTPPNRVALTALLLLTAACDVEPTELIDTEEPESILDADPADRLEAPSAPVAAAADCCAADSTAGCTDVAVEECVCETDAYCCNVAWDAICVGEVDSLGCGTCETTMPCCATDSAAGCAEEPTVESCVCAADVYCCNVAWDALCVSEVDSLGCGTCGAVDLAITDVDLPAVACPGEDIAPSTALTVANVGTADATSMFHISWTLSNDATLDGSDRLLLGGRDQVLSLAGGASTSVGIGVNQLPGDASPGPQYIIVNVDEFDGIIETDEANNVVAVPITIETDCASPGEWVRQIGGSSSENLEASGAVTVDADGNTYLLGSSLSSSLDLGQGEQPNQGSGDVFLVSYDADGMFRWSRWIGGADLELSGGVGVDAAGNVYVAGESEGPLDLGGGALPASGGSRDLWIASYTTTGAHRWSQRHGGIGAGLLATDLSVDASGDLVVVGRLTGSASLGGAVLSSAGFTDGFALALDSSGTHRWSRTFGGTGDDQLTGVAVDSNGGAALVGYLSGTVDLGTGPLVSAGSADGLLVRVDSTGATDWAQTYGGTGIDIAQDVALDDAGRAFMVGTFYYGTIDLGAGPLVAAGTSEMVVAGYDATGAIVWSLAGGSGGLDYARGIDLDADGHPVVTGSSFGGPIELGGAPVSGMGFYDLFYASYDAASGAHRSSGGLGTAAQEEGFDVAISPAGTMVIAGTFTDTLTVVGSTLTSEGSTDVFVASIQP